VGAALPCPALQILSNGLQGLMFSVIWRLGQDYWNAHVADKKS
jgi:hypothetical protein